MRKVQSEASNNEVEVITLTVMLQLGIQDDEDAEYNNSERTDTFQLHALLSVGKLKL